jgi:hypothetical protein
VLWLEERQARSREQGGSTMPAPMIDDRKGITASWAIFQRHTSPVAGFGAIARSDSRYVSERKNSPS